MAASDSQRLRARGCRRRAPMAAPPAVLAPLFFALALGAGVATPAVAQAVTRSAAQPAAQSAAQPAAQRVAQATVAGPANAAEETALARALAAAERNHGIASAELLPLLNRQADLLEGAGRSADAVAVRQRIVAIEEKTLGASHLEVAASLNELGNTLRGAGRYAEALLPIERGLAIRERALGRDHPLVATSLNSLGAARSALGQHTAALEAYRRGLAIFEKNPGPASRVVAITLNNLAEAHRQLGQYADALPQLQRSLAILQAAPGAERGSPELAAAMNNLGRIYRLIGQYDEALPWYQRSLATSERVAGAEHADTAGALNNLGYLYMQLDRPADALPHFRRSLAIWQKQHPDHPDVARSLNNLGLLHQRLGQPAEAMQFHERGLALRERVLGSEHPDVADSLNNVAALLVARNEPARAVPLLLRAERIAAATRNAEILWRSQQGLRAAFQRLGQADVAIFWGKQAVNSLQQLRAGLAQLDRELQRGFLVDKRAAYGDLADLLIVNGRLAEAQQVMSMLKEEEFFDFVRRDSGSDPRQTQVALTGVERGAHERFYAVREELARLSSEHETLRGAQQRGAASPADVQRLQAIESDLARSRAAFDAFVGGLAQLLSTESAAARRTDAIVGQIESHQNLLVDLGAAGKGVAAVQYVSSEQRLHIVVSTADFQIAREVALPRAELNRRIADFRHAIQDPRTDPRPLARALSAQLIEPIRRDLEAQGVRTLLLFLDGALRYVPFAALTVGDGWLIERYGLAIYTEAARSRLAVAPSARWQVAGLGVTRAFPALNFSALPAVRGELEGIVRPDVLPGAALLDDQFTLPALIKHLSNPVLHIASHFRFVPGSEASFLLLGDGNVLTLRQLRTELPRLNQVELLTLSACETAVGGGHAENGLEVEGLGVLAQKQGARAVMATLWSVADASTGQLMQQFYRLRQSGTLDKAEALRRAQLALLRGTGAGAAGSEASGQTGTESAGDRGVERGAIRLRSGAAGFTPDPAAPYAHPYYWAPFILMGNWL